MKLTLPALALAGAISVSGCASLNTGTMDVQAILAAVDATLNTSCAVLNGSLPTLQSIQAIIAANVPGLVVANNAVVTGENIAKQICAAAVKAASTPSSAMRLAQPKAGVHAPLNVDGVPVYFQ